MMPSRIVIRFSPTIGSGMSPMFVSGFPVLPASVSVLMLSRPRRESNPRCYGAVSVARVSPRAAAHLRVLRRGSGIRAVASLHEFGLLHHAQVWLESLPAFGGAQLRFVVAERRDDDHVFALLPIDGRCDFEIVGELQRVERPQELNRTGSGALPPFLGGIRATLRRWGARVDRGVCLGDQRVHRGIATKPAAAFFHRC